MTRGQDGSPEPQRSDDPFDEIVAPTDEGAVTDADTAVLAASEDNTATRRTWRERLGVWPTVMRRNRVLWITASAAVVALVAGLLLGRFVLAPTDSAAGADAPAPGLVTVPVEFGPLSNDVTIRGDVGFADPVEVQIDTSSISGPAVVTGQVPELGAELGPLAIALEVAGRPVIALPGELPSYRTLRFGVSGPDVVQFKEAMRAVGIDAGDPANPAFDEQAASAVTALYAAVGYTAPTDEEGGEENVRFAQDAVRSAEQNLAAAQNELATAGDTAGRIADAELQLTNARATLKAARASDDATWAEVVEAQNGVRTAEAALRAAHVAPDTSGAQAAVDAAAAALDQARADLGTARQGALPFLPSGEVLYLTELPRRVDAVSARRGSILEGPAMTVSGATVALTGSAAEADATLLTVGSVATFDLADGAEHTATVTAVEPGAEGEARWSITLEPAPLTPEQIMMLQGSNVRIIIAVGATAGDVLSVPTAALTAGPGGETRVEVVDGDPRDADTETRLVVVETGLSADGAVEVRAIEGGDLSEGDLVVVGR